MSSTYLVRSSPFPSFSSTVNSDHGSLPFNIVRLCCQPWHIVPSPLLYPQRTSSAHPAIPPDFVLWLSDFLPRGGQGGRNRLWQSHAAHLRGWRILPCCFVGEHACLSGILPSPTRVPGISARKAFQVLSVLYGFRIGRVSQIDRHAPKVRGFCTDR